jgi:hypothetical protein
VTVLRLLPISICWSIGVFPARKTQLLALAAVSNNDNCFVEQKIYLGYTRRAFIFYSFISALRVKFSACKIQLCDLGFEDKTRVKNASQFSLESNDHPRMLLQKGEDYE